MNYEEHESLKSEVVKLREENLKLRVENERLTAEIKDVKCLHRSVPAQSIPAQSIPAQSAQYTPEEVERQKLFELWFFK